MIGFVPTGHAALGNILDNGKNLELKVEIGIIAFFISSIYFALGFLKKAGMSHFFSSSNSPPSLGGAYVWFT